MNILIITPVKNESQFISTTIRSVIKQSVLPNKWIIVDDGSTDNTVDVINELISNHVWIELKLFKTKNSFQPKLSILESSVPSLFQMLEKLILCLEC